MALDVSNLRADGTDWRARFSRPLTPSEHTRVRIGLSLIPVVAWLFVAWGTFALDNVGAGRLDRSGHIKGHDFIHFYVLGQIASEHASNELYSGEAQAARNDRLLPEYKVRYLPIHAPQVALFFAPLAGLPYVTALNTWLLGSAILYAVCCALLVSTLPNLRSHTAIVVLCGAAFPGLYGVMASGQTTAWALLWLTLAYLSLKHHRPFLAGLCFGTLIYKPTLGLVLPFVLLYSRAWRVIFGAGVAIALQFAVAWLYFGSDTLIEYFANFKIAIGAIGALESQPWQMHSLRAFFANSLPWPAVASWLSLAASVGVIVFAVRTWHSTRPLSVRYAVLLMATILVSPHVYTYELLVLAPAFLLTASFAIEQKRTSLLLLVLLYLAYAMPALPSVAVATHVQWSVPALAALMIALSRSPYSANQIAGAAA